MRQRRALRVVGRYNNTNNTQKFELILIEIFGVRLLFPKYHFFNTARIEGKEYTDILLVFEDCVAQLAADVSAHDDDVRIEESETASDYPTPYIDLMWQAIDHFKISNHYQPIKDILVDWFLAQEIAGQNVSRATAEYLASFVGFPSRVWAGIGHGK